MDFYSLNQLTPYAEDFFFQTLDNIKINDAIAIHNPQDAWVVTPVVIRSRKTLEEHIEYIRSNNVKKAIVVAEDIQFLKQCPSLEYLKILPAVTAENFDFSPLYELPNVRWLSCDTMYGLGAMYRNEKVKISTIDYSRFDNLEMLSVKGAEGHLNVHAPETVRTLYFEFGFPKEKTLTGFVPGKNLENFFINSTPIQSLDGIEAARKLHRLELSYNRSLTDISALRHLKDSLQLLEIEACGKIRDFSVLNELENLEFLTLKGSNVLPDLSFLRSLPKLKNLHLTMCVEDGDLSLCEHLPYARIQNRKHYSHKDKDLPKNYTDPNVVYPYG